MSNRKKILALIAGVITALLLLIYSNGDLSKAIGFFETKKPATDAPAFSISK